jgi:hypothetical protein
MNFSPMTTDLLIDQTLSWLYADCDNEMTCIRFCTKARSQPCFHALDLASCIKVSKQWFLIGARHLWERYAGFEQLMSLISDSSDHSDDIYYHDVRTLHQHYRWTSTHSRPNSHSYSTRNRLLDGSSIPDSSRISSFVSFIIIECSVTCFLSSNLQCTLRTNHCYHDLNRLRSENGGLRHHALTWSYCIF